jgi:small subunit ribosomal protein S16
MAVIIRLARYGAKKKPFYRVVATDNRSPRDGRFLDLLGTYDPMDKQKGINLNMDAIRNWIARGAEVSDTVNRIMKKSGSATQSSGQ